ncbi:hypothetical protein BJ742DRAFT_734845 [Cladochytrium replicatum]|nr:hypothetical protein BJ742DRAFT_734845 [Cladochytrium replicatum]
MSSSESLEVDIGLPCASQQVKVDVVTSEHIPVFVQNCNPIGDALPGFVKNSKREKILHEDQEEIVHNVCELEQQFGSIDRMCNNAMGLDVISRADFHDDLLLFPQTLPYGNVLAEGNELRALLRKEPLFGSLNNALARLKLERSKMAHEKCSAQLRTKSSISFDTDTPRPTHKCMKRGFEYADVQTGMIAREMVKNREIVFAVSPYSSMQQYLQAN